MVVTDLPVGDGFTIISSGGKTRFIFPRPGAGLEPSRSKHTHDVSGSYGVVYVNDLGRAAMLSDQPSVFPTGSIIVREKLAKIDDARPQLLAVMVKRERGFSHKTGDWEFLTVDGALIKILQRSKKGECLDCHESQRARDFVFALPATHQ